MGNPTEVDYNLLRSRVNQLLNTVEYWLRIEIETSVNL